MKKTITSFMFFLLSVIVMPVYGQAAGSVQADKFDDEVIFRISGGLNYNSLCDKKKFGAGAGLDMKNRRDRFLILSARNDMAFRQQYENENCIFLYDQIVYKLKK